MRDQERGRGIRPAQSGKLDFFCFSCSSTAVLRTSSQFVTLLRTAVETAIT